MEKWKDIPSFAGYYEASDLGRIRRKKSQTIYKDGRVANFSQTILKAGFNKKGYKRVYLSLASKKYTKSVHRLVAETFIPNPENKPTVNHINMDKLDNKVSNLEWMTNKENMRHAFDNGAFDERNKYCIKNITDNI